MKDLFAFGFVRKQKGRSLKSANHPSSHRSAPPSPSRVARAAATISLRALAALSVALIVGCSDAGDEVAVGKQAFAETVLQNYALNQPATESSSAYGGDAGRAVDGNTDGAFGGRSVTHTDADTNAWWQVDLGR